MAPDPTIDYLHRRINSLEDKINKKFLAPTVPTYDSSNFPQDAVHGQIAKDTNHDAWIYGEDDTWHKIGGASGGGAHASFHYDRFGVGATLVSLPAEAGFVDTPKGVPFTFKRSIDQTAITYDNESNLINGTPYTTITLNPGFSHEGIYQVHAAGQFSNVSGNGDMLIYGFGNDQLPHISWGYNSSLDVFDISPKGATNVLDYAEFYLPADSSQSIYLRFVNRDTFDKSVNFAYMTVTYISMSNPDGVDPRIP